MKTVRLVIAAIVLPAPGKVPDPNLCGTIWPAVPDARRAPKSCSSRKFDRNQSAPGNLTDFSPKILTIAKGVLPCKTLFMA